MKIEVSSRKKISSSMLDRVRYRSISYLCSGILGLIFACHINTAKADHSASDILDLSLKELLAIDVRVASGVATPLKKAPATASVIVAEQIAVMGATDIDDVLETIPGLHINRDRFGYAPQYTLRGISTTRTPQVLMLINGIPVTNLFLGDRHYMWGGMPVKAISRIEVIRGSGSALYGAEAFAGVINIITKSHDDIKANSMGVRSGRFDTQDAWLEYAGEWNHVTSALILEYHETDGHKQTIDKDKQSSFDDQQSTSASLAPGPVNLLQRNLDMRLDLERKFWQLRAGVQQRYGGSGVGIGASLDPYSRYASSRYNMDITYNNQKFTEDFGLIVQQSYLDTSQEWKRDSRIFPAGAVHPSPAIGGPYLDGIIGTPEIWERHYRFNVTGIYGGLENHKIRLGVGHYLGDMYRVRESKNFGIDPDTGLPIPVGDPVVDVSDTPYAFLQEGKRRNNFMLAQDIFSFLPNWQLTTGVRYDHYSDFSDVTNPRISIVWTMKEDIIIRMFLNTAFRAPAFHEMRGANNPSTLGNPNLKPEKIKSAEINFSYAPVNRLQQELTFFKYRADDMIEFVADSTSPGASRTAQNIGETHGEGFEYELIWQAANTFRIKANYAMQNARDNRTGKKIAGAPRQQIFIETSWAIFTKWHLSSSINRVMDRPRAVGDPRQEIENYSMFNLALHGRGIIDNWSIGFIMRNLFDEDAREPTSFSDQIPGDLPLAGRNFNVEVEYKFSD